MNLPELRMPSLRDDEPYVEMSVMVCRTCTQTGQWARSDSQGAPVSDSEDASYTWATDHTRANPTHTQFHRWALTRSTAHVRL